MKIIFNEDGTFEEYLAAETGDPKQYGTYSIEDDSVTLKVEKYGDYDFEEAQEVYGDGLEETPDRTLTLKESIQSIQFPYYLEENGRILYWNRSSMWPENLEKEYESYVLLTTNEALTPKNGASTKSSPQASSTSYEFTNPDDGEHELSEIHERVLARTKFKETLNDTEDYWYLVKVNVPYYSTAKLNDNYVSIYTAWVHGSELE